MARRFGKGWALSATVGVVLAMGCTGLTSSPDDGLTNDCDGVIQALGCGTAMGGGSDAGSGAPGPAGAVGPTGPAGARADGGVPSVSGVNPDAVGLGQTVGVMISGSDTSWTADAGVSFGAGVTVNTVTVGSVTALFANITVDADAGIGVRNVTVTEGSETSTLVGVFSVQAGKGGI